MPNHVVVIGGGASGSLLATQLLRQSNDVQVCIVEPSPVLALGIAYSTPCPAHLLNVPAARMSAFPDSPRDFVDWLDAKHPKAYAPGSFVPRAVYGEYLNDTLQRARFVAHNRFVHIQAGATSVRTTPTGVVVTTAGGGTVHADSAVVAIGNSAPAPWRGLDAIAARGSAVFQSAWEPGALIPARRNEAVLLLGTGLTAVDAVLGLRHNGHGGVIHMISRRGLLPHEHRLFDAPPQAESRAASMEDMLATMREAVRASGSRVDWRAVVDGVRSRTNIVWQSMDVRTQRRFMRHALPYWNAHRHRMAPHIARKLAELISSGHLRMIAGRTGSITSAGGHIDVTIAPRGGASPSTLRIDRLINCSGPQHDVTKLSNPLIVDMIARGSLVPHELGVGARVAGDGALYRDDGTASSRLYAIGPVRFGTLIETTAIPEIREQAAALAALLIAKETVGSGQVAL